MPLFNKNKFSNLPPPPSDKSGALTDDAYKSYLQTLPPPPSGAKGVSDAEMRAQGHDMNVTDTSAALANSTHLNLTAAKDPHFLGSLKSPEVKEQGAGQSIGDALYANHAADIVGKIGEDKSKIAMALVQRIHDDKAAGKTENIDRLSKTYQDLVGEPLPDLGEITPSINKTGKQIAGEFGELGARLVSGAEIPASLLGQVAQFATIGAAGSGSHALAEGGTNQEALQAAKKGGAISGILGGALGAFGKGFQKLFGASKAFDPAAAAAFEEAGIKPPVSAVTNSKFIQGAESLSSKGLFGQKILDLVGEANNKLDAKATSIVERMTPGKSMSDENLGKTLQQGLKEYEDNFKVTEGKVYDAFSKTYGKSNTYAMATKDALNTIIKEQGQDYFAGQDPRLVRMFNRITGADNPELKAISDTIEEAKGVKAPQAEIDRLEKEFAAKQSDLNRDLSFDELKATRSSVGERLQKEPENTALKRLYGALSQDMQTAVKTHAATPFGDEAKAASEALDKLNKGYATGKAKIESNIASSISQSNPEQIAQNLIKRNSAATLQQVKEMVGPERFAEVQKSFMRQLFEGSDVRGKFDIAKLNRTLENYDQETLKELLSPEQADDLKVAVSELEKNKALQDLMKKGAGIGSGSQTAHLERIAATMNKAPVRSIAFTSALASGHPGVAALVLLEPASEYLMSKMFTSELGRKILTEGVNPANIELMKNFGLSAAQIAEVQNATKSDSQ